MNKSKISKYSHYIFFGSMFTWVILGAIEITTDFEVPAFIFFIQAGAALQFLIILFKYGVYYVTKKETTNS